MITGKTKLKHKSKRKSHCIAASGKVEFSDVTAANLPWQPQPATVENSK